MFFREGKGRGERLGLRNPEPAGQKAEDLLGEEEVGGKAFFRSLALNGESGGDGDDDR